MTSDPRSLGYSMIGMIANSWAMVEQCVDLTNAIIFTRHEARSYEKRIPIALEAKLKFLRRAANRIDVQASHRAEILPFVEDALALRQRRHVIIHGVATGFSVHGVVYDILRNENDRILIGQVSFTLQQMHDLLRESNDLAQRAHDLEGRFRSAWIEDGSQPYSQLGGG